MYKFKQKQIRKIIEKYNIPKIEGFDEILSIKDFVWPSDWMEDHFLLTTAYATEGGIKLFSWQKLPLNAVIHFEETTYIGPVQTGKSLLGEGATAYYIDNHSLNMMLIYAKKETVEDVLEERIKPLILEVPAINKYWKGKENDLTKKKIKLIHLIMRVASGGNKKEIATHNAGFVYCSEIAKWPVKDFDSIKAVKGRTQASRMVGQQTKIIYETSPEHTEDPSYRIAHRDGTLYLKPAYPCPKCGKYQLFYDEKIKEMPNRKGIKDHNPERIRLEHAAYLECEHCKYEIKEENRLECSFNMQWAIVDIKNKNKIIELVGQDGKNLDVHRDKHQKRFVVCNWNRLVDVTMTFYEYLAMYFEALKSVTTEALKTYRNEDEADWVKLKAERYGEKYIDSKKGQYYQFGDKAIVPAGVNVILCSIDTQDTGFWYVVRGYGLDMESWLVRQDFIHCDMKDYPSRPEDVTEIIEKELNKPFYKKGPNGLLAKMHIFAKIIDRGGHRSKDVDYYCRRVSNAYPYIGSTSLKGELVELKKSGFYYGVTERLSRIVAKQIESSMWHLPKDVSREYKTQVLNQYDEKWTDSRGNERTKWITKDPDHSRDCENYLIALCLILKLEDQFKTPEEVRQLEREVQAKPEEKPRTENIIKDHLNAMNNEGW